MVNAPVVAVRGEASREVPPEIGRFTVQVLARDHNRATTLQRLAQRAQALNQLLDGYQEIIEKRETGHLSVHPERRRSGERVAAYQGQLSTTVTVLEFTALGDLMLRLADQDQTTVHGPWWELRPGSPVFREARRGAIDDALARARDYADAVGARVLRLIEIADVGLTSQPVMRERRMATEAFGLADRSDAGAAPELDLDPQAQTVFAQIEARFEISEPTALAEPVD